MHNIPHIFNYQEKQVRTVLKDGQPWFVAKDVCTILELGDTHKAVHRLAENMKGTNTIPTHGGNQDVLVINEAGLYKLVFTSRKPEAERFTDWVASEVLPDIRKHGAYMTDITIEKALTDPDFLIKLATQLKEEKEARKELAATLEKQKPMVLFAQAVEVSHTSILIGDLAKLIKQNGYDIGQQRLFEWLRNNGYLIKSGSSKNIPTQRSMDMGLFEVKESTVNNPDGSVRITKTTKCTGKGQVYFVNKFLQ